MCLKIFLVIIDGQQFKNNEFRFKGGVIWLVIWEFCYLYCSSFILSEVFKHETLVLISFIVFEKFLVIMSSSISSALFSTFSSPCGTQLGFTFVCHNEKSSSNCWTYCGNNLIVIYTFMCEKTL